MKVRQVFAVAVAAVALGVSGLAFAQAARSPAEAADYRHQQFRRVGATFKAINDGVRGGADFAGLRANAQTLAQLAQDLPTWFPAGSGPESGAHTHAKAEVWSNAAAWNEQVAQFRAATQALAAAGDSQAFGGQARAVGARCGSCHQAFRVQD